MVRDLSLRKPAPATDISNTLSTWEGQELSKSDRPELTSARIVISGGKESFESTDSVCGYLGMLQRSVLPFAVHVSVSILSGGKLFCRS